MLFPGISYLQVRPRGAVGEQGRQGSWRVVASPTRESIFDCSPFSSLNTAAALRNARSPPLLRAREPPTRIGVSWHRFRAHSLRPASRVLQATIAVLSRTTRILLLRRVVAPGGVGLRWRSLSAPFCGTNCLPAPRYSGRAAMSPASCTPATLWVSRDLVAIISHHVGFFPLSGRPEQYEHTRNVLV